VDFVSRIFDYLYYFNFFKKGLSTDLSSYLAIFVFGSYFYHSGISFHSKFFISRANNKSGSESFA